MVSAYVPSLDSAYLYVVVVVGPQAAMRAATPGTGNEATQLWSHLSATSATTAAAVVPCCLEEELAILVVGALSVLDRFRRGFP